MRCRFLDTGALYRAVAHLVLKRSANPEDESVVSDLLAHNFPQVVTDAGFPLGYGISIDGEILCTELFTSAVSKAVSPIAAMPSVRSRLVIAQRDFANNHDVVMAGRDIGSVVLPDAAFKFFLSASVDARVDRRLKELVDGGIAMDRETLRAEIQARDERDTTRHVSPLVKAADAIQVDTSDHDVISVVDILEAFVRGEDVEASSNRNNPYYS